MTRKIASITDVAERNLCCGCGVCAFAQPDDVRMVDDLTAGRRPVVDDRSADTSLALSCCPGVGLSHTEEARASDESGLFDGWGPVLEVWEGHAADPEIRFAGSSGGVATALGLHSIEAGARGAIHIRQRQDAPLLNETTLSTERSEFVAATGSRYAPASPCDGLAAAGEGAAPVAFIGKPCDVAAVKKSEAAFPSLADDVAITIAIFCAGAPSTAGTIDMLSAMGVGEDAVVSSVRYRGRGWPGRATVEFEDDRPETSLSYQESWGAVLERHRPWRCRVCIDHTGEFADIAVGDPWYRPVQPDEPGSSLVVVRTERGRAFLRSAIDAGAVELERVPDRLLAESQPNLLKTRGAVWGRIMASRLLLLPAPRYEHMPTFRHWWGELTVIERIRSFTGTVKRIVSRRLHRRRPVEPLDPSSLPYQ